jgi:hypothetical protein
LRTALGALPEGYPGRAVPHHLRLRAAISGLLSKDEAQMTVVPIQNNPDSLVELDDIADALDRQIDLMWALIAGFQTIQSEHPRSVHQKRAGFS